MAQELRAVLDDLDHRQADDVARVAQDLESDSEDFSEWETRSEASERLCRAARDIERKGVACNA